METQTLNVTRVTALAVPLSIAVVESAMLMWERAVGSPADPIYAMAKEAWGLTILIAVTLAACTSLLWRYRFTGIVLIAEISLSLISAYWDADSLVLAPALVAFYALVRTADERRIYIGSVAMMLTMTATAFMARPGAFISEWIGRMLVLTVIGAIAMALRGMNQAKTANERALDEHRRAEAITAQRDAALKRSRIAGQLHDSVGHGLTTIIALSEGLTGKTADPRVEDALTGINQIARESLSDTREAVRALAETDGIESMGETPGEASPESDASAHSHISPYTWDDIKPILAHVRALGIIALFTETGRRSDDPAQADLCFTITREAITNAIRHGSEITHISVAWDHADDGGITVLIRDDGMGIGSSAKVPTVAPIGSSAASNSQHNRMPHSNGGTGLPRLADTVRAAGGSMEHGPQDDGDGWQVKAVLPAGRSCQLGLGERDAA